MLLKELVLLKEIVKTCDGCESKKIVTEMAFVLMSLSLIKRY